MTEDKKLKTGTTTVGLKCTDGIILASESRATMGGFIEDKNVQKILPIQKNIAITVAGLVGDAQVLARVMQAECALYEKQRNRPISVESAATLLANILQSNKYYPYWVGLIMGGYHTEPKLYSLDAAGGLVEKEDISSTGSGSPTAYGVLEDKYIRNGTMKQNLPVAVRAIKIAMERDAFSGNRINLATITQEGIKYYNDKEIQEIMKAQ